MHTPTLHPDHAHTGEARALEEDMSRSRQHAASLKRQLSQRTNETSREHELRQQLKTKELEIEKLRQVCA